MRIPRDISGAELVKALKGLGYEVTRQTGSHMRVTSLQKGEHHVTIPNHSPLRLGTFSGILADVAGHFGMSRSELVMKLFGSGR